MRNGGIKKRTLYLTLSAMLCALGVVILALGSLIEVLDLTAAVLASMLCIYAVIELGGVYPWLIWLVTSLLALLLIPLKTPAIFYAMFAGFYPILKEKIERWRLPWRLLSKLGVFHVSLGAIYLVLRLFLPQALEDLASPLLPILFYLLSLLAFWLYDLALTRLITFYLVRLRHRFRIRD